METWLVVGSLVGDMACGWVVSWRHGLSLGGWLETWLVVGSLVETCLVVGSLMANWQLAG